MSNRQKPKAGPTKTRPSVAAAQSNRIVVAYIHPGETSAYFTQSLTNMLMFDQATGRHVVGCINEWSSANVSAARNNVVTEFLTRDAEWLLFIDADMAWDHDAIDRLLASANRASRPIVGGLCFGANADGLFPTIYQMAEVDGLPTTIRVNDFPADSLVQCAATGAAFVLIHRTVLEAMAARAFNAAFPWFQETEIGGRPCGEDITFCLRAGMLGFPVHVDTSILVGHHKSTLLDNATFRAQRAMEDTDA